VCATAALGDGPTLQRGVDDHRHVMKLPVSRKIRFHARASRERTVGWVIPLCFMWSRFWTCAPRDGSLAEYTAVEARNLAPSPPTSTTPWRQRYRSPGSPRRPPRSPATGAVPARRSSRSRMIWREMSVRDRCAVLAGGCFWRCRISSALALVFCSRVWATPGVTRPTPPTAATAHTPRPSRSPTTHPPPPTASCWSSSSRSTTQHPEPAGQ